MRLLGLDQRDARTGRRSWVCWLFLSCTTCVAGTRELQLSFQYLLVKYCIFIIVMQK